MYYAREKSIKNQDWYVELQSILSLCRVYWYHSCCLIISRRFLRVHEQVGTKANLASNPAGKAKTQRITGTGIPTRAVLIYFIPISLTTVAAADLPIIMMSQSMQQRPQFAIVLFAHCPSPDLQLSCIATIVSDDPATTLSTRGMRTSMVCESENVVALEMANRAYMPRKMLIGWSDCILQKSSNGGDGEDGGVIRALPIPSTLEVIPSNHDLHSPIIFSEVHTAFVPSFHSDRMGVSYLDELIHRRLNKLDLIIEGCWVSIVVTVGFFMYTYYSISGGRLWKIPDFDSHSPKKSNDSSLRSTETLRNRDIGKNDGNCNSIHQLSPPHELLHEILYQLGDENVRTFSTSSETFSMDLDAVSDIGFEELVYDEGSLKKIISTDEKKQILRSSKQKTGWQHLPSPRRLFEDTSDSTAKSGNDMINGLSQPSSPGKLFEQGVSDEKVEEYNMEQNLESHTEGLSFLPGIAPILTASVDEACIATIVTPNKNFTNAKYLQPQDDKDISQPMSKVDGANLPDYITARLAPRPETNQLKSNPDSVPEDRLNLSIQVATLSKSEEDSSEENSATPSRHSEYSCYSFDSVEKSVGVNSKTALADEGHSDNHLSEENTEDDKSQKSHLSVISKTKNGRKLQNQENNSKLGVESTSIKKLCSQNDSPTHSTERKSTFEGLRRKWTEKISGATDCSKSRKDEREKAIKIETSESCSTSLGLQRQWTDKTGISIKRLIPPKSNKVSNIYNPEKSFLDTYWD